MLVTIGYTMLAIGFILIVLSLVFTVVWKVPSLIDELSGRKAKRQIERMRKLNIASSNLTGMDTAEFYRSMSEGNLVINRVKTNDRNSVDSSELSKLVDNPYNVSTDNKVVVQKDDYCESDDIVTDLFDEVVKGYNIKIVEEQSSLF